MHRLLLQAQVGVLQRGVCGLQFPGAPFHGKGEQLGRATEHQAGCERHPGEKDADRHCQKRGFAELLTPEVATGLGLEAVLAVAERQHLGTGPRCRQRQQGPGVQGVADGGRQYGAVFKEELAVGRRRLVHKAVGHHFRAACAAIWHPELAKPQCGNHAAHQALHAQHRHSKPDRQARASLGRRVVKWAQVQRTP